jgi:hypothetical protein
MPRRRGPKVASKSLKAALTSAVAAQPDDHGSTAEIDLLAGTGDVANG